MPTRVLDTDAELAEILEIILRVTAPLKVLLFGSRVSGELRPGSDYDILVVKDGVENGREYSRLIQRALLAQRIRTPVDVIVVDSRRFAAGRRQRGTVYHWGDEQGEVLYG